MVVGPHPSDLRIFSGPWATLLISILAPQVTNFDHTWFPEELVNRSAAVGQRFWGTVSRSADNVAFVCPGS